MKWIFFLSAQYEPRLVLDGSLGPGRNEKYFRDIYAFFSKGYLFCTPCLEVAIPALVKKENQVRT